MKQRLPIVVFARAPAPGAVKTRLAGAVGHEGAATLARAFLRDTWDALSAVAWADPVVATTGPLGEAFAGVKTQLQGEGDLGARMERALRRALGGAPAAFAVGTDSPGMPRYLLDAAREALRDADAVIGPSEDGGFYLLGLRRCPEGLLARLPWSRADTGSRVCARLRRSGFRVARAPRWFDVDRPADLRRLAALLDAGRLCAPATHAALSQLGVAARARGESPRISVVIPTLDEAARIGWGLAELARMEGIAEVVVVDGGSADATASIARSFAGVQVLRAPRGRARQMNAGAAAATGDVLLFLHADVALPRDAPRHVREALAAKDVVAGAFRTWTVADRGRTLLAPLLHLADLRSRYTRLPYGDQALFVRADVFRRLGGFAHVPLMEDLELSRRLRRAGRLRTVRASVRVSGRRFLARPVYYTFLVNVFPLLYRLGVPPARLARLYGDPR